MSDNKIRVSSRAVLQLLSGDISQEIFFELHGWTENSTVGNVFLHYLRSGRMFSGVKIIDASECNDDWLEFEFGANDPVISPFTTPTL